MKKLTQEQRALWTTALRSGKYAQGRAGKLVAVRDGVFEYCCLGVLKEVCNLVTDSTDYLTCASVEDSVRISGLTPDSAQYLPDRVQRYLAIANDEDDWSFPRIADYVDEQLGEFFE